MLNLARCTSVLGNLGPVTVRNSVQRCVMEVLMMFYKLWTVLWRSSLLSLFIHQCKAHPMPLPPLSGLPRPSLPVGSSHSVVHTGDEYRHPLVDVGCEHGIQIQLLHVEATLSPADLQICHGFVSSDLPGTGATSELTQALAVVVYTLLKLWPLFSSKLHKHAFFSPPFLVRCSSIWKKVDRRVAFAGGPLPLQKEGRHWFLL